jgi:methionyl-tRNA formyltransferase
VKVAAQSEGLEVLQPERASDPALLHAVRHLAPDVGVVVAYGHILAELLRTPRRGMVNVHRPPPRVARRGSDRVGDPERRRDDRRPSCRWTWRWTPGLSCTACRIASTRTTGGELSDHLAEMGAQALIEALALWEQDSLRPVPQDHALATYAPKLTREIARIDWTKPADVIVRQTLALDPRPGAWTELDGHEVKLFEGSVAPGSAAAGEVILADGRLLIAAGTAPWRWWRYSPPVRPACPPPSDPRPRVTAGRRRVRRPLPRLHAVIDERVARRPDVAAVAGALAEPAAARWRCTPAGRA